MASTVWGMTKHCDPGGYSFSSLPRTPHLDSPHISLVHSTLPQPEPRVNGCKQNFVCWPFKRLSVSPAVSTRQTDTLLLFTSRYYLGPFPGFVDLSWGAQLEAQTLHFSERTPWQLKFPSGTSAATCGNPASPLTPLLHLSLVIMLLSSQCSVGYSGWFLYNLAVVPDWSGEEVSVASTYFSTILGLCREGKYFFNFSLSFGFYLVVLVPLVDNHFVRKSPG